MREKIVTLKNVSKNGKDAYKKALMSDKDILDLQKRLASGELESVEGDKSEAIPFEMVEKYVKEMK